MPIRSWALSYGPCLLVCSVAACFNPTGQTTETTPGTSTATGTTTAGPTSDTTVDTTVVPVTSTLPTTSATGPDATGPDTTGGTTGGPCEPACQSPAHYCVDGQCWPCHELPRGTDCAAIDPGLPLCEPLSGLCKECLDGSHCVDKPGKLCNQLEFECVQCVSHGDCKQPNAPLCDKEANVCRGCVEHEECGERACDLDVGQCFPDAAELTQILYVKPGDVDCAAKSGSFGDPLCSIVDALVKADVLATHLVIHVAPGDGGKVDAKPIAINDLKFSGKVIAIRGGDDVTLSSGDQDTPTLAIDNNLNAKLFVAGVHVTMYGGNHAVRCSGSNLLWLDDVRIDKTKHAILDIPATALLGQSCELIVRRGELVDNERAILAGGGSLRLVNTIVAGSNEPLEPAITANGLERLEILYSTIADAKGTPGSLLTCSMVMQARIRNSALVTGPGDGDEVACDGLTINSSAVPWMGLVGLGEGNQYVPDPTAEFVDWPADLHLAPTAMSFADIAVWRLDPLDPIDDIDGDLRPAKDGALDWAGADRPQR